MLTHYQASKYNEDLDNPWLGYKFSYKEGDLYCFSKLMIDKVDYTAYKYIRVLEEDLTNGYYKYMFKYDISRR